MCGFLEVINLCQMSLELENEQALFAVLVMIP